MKRTVLVPILAAAAGAGGCVLRRLQIAQGFDASTGLALSNPWAPALLGLSLAVAAVLLILSLGGKGEYPCYAAALRCRNPLYLGACAVSAVLLLEAGVLFCRDGLQVSVVAGHQALSMLLGLCCLCAFAAVLVLTVWNRSGKGEGRRMGTTMLPALTACVWLLATYRDEATNPIVGRYSYEILAVMAAGVALYFLAACSFEEHLPARRFLFTAGLGTYLCLTALGGGRSLANNLIYIAFALYLLASSGALLSNPGIAGRREAGLTDTADAKDTEVSVNE